MSFPTTPKISPLKELKSYLVVGFYKHLISLGSKTRSKKTDVFSFKNFWIHHNSEASVTAGSLNHHFELRCFILH
jgi:hypothetical protein